MKKKFNLIIIFIFLSFCFIVFYKGLNNPNIYTPKIINKKDIPIFKARDFNSNIFISSENIFEKNNYYIVNIWASWCVPCRKEHPLLMKLSKNQSVKLIGLNYRDNLNNAKKFIKELGNPYTQILIDNDGTLGVEFGAYGVPETFLIDKNKKVIKKFVGPINKENLEEIRLIIK
jgi:cytochrome c biogenesis protein CcmG/thiol:disulfide interchange protein DsbE|tara:strand:- start:827 stop:1348 length:522 start_codon:yes stop_codon:yes gene_type:complete